MSHPSANCCEDLRYPGRTSLFSGQAPEKHYNWNLPVKRSTRAMCLISGWWMTIRGYIMLTQFTEDAGRNVADALKKLQEDHPDLSGVILDLRGNPGGLLREAVNVSNVFIPKRTGSGQYPWSCGRMGQIFCFHQQPGRYRDTAGGAYQQKFCICFRDRCRCDTRL